MQRHPICRSLDRAAMEFSVVFGGTIPLRPRFSSWEQIGNTCPFNVTHHPAISLPCGYGAGGRPIGLMLVARHWRESTLYRAAHAFEQAVNWKKLGPARRK